MYGSRPQAPTPTWTQCGRGTGSTAEQAGCTRAMSSHTYVEAWNNCSSWCASSSETIKESFMCSCINAAHCCLFGCWVLAAAGWSKLWVKITGTLERWALKIIFWFCLLEGGVIYFFSINIFVYIFFHTASNLQDIKNVYKKDWCDFCDSILLTK